MGKSLTAPFTVTLRTAAQASKGWVPLGGAGFERRGNQDRIPCPLFPTVDTTVKDSRTFHLCRAVGYLNLAVEFPDSTSILFYIKDSLPNGKARIKETAHTPQMVWDDMLSQLHGDGKT